jgi:hypothetical protein
VIKATLLIGIQIVNEEIGTDVDHITLVELNNLIVNRRVAKVPPKEDPKKYETKTKFVQKQDLKITQDEWQNQVAKKLKKIDKPAKQNSHSAGNTVRHYFKPSSAWRDGTGSNLKDVLFTDGMWY